MMRGKYDILEYGDTAKNFSMSHSSLFIEIAEHLIQKLKTNKKSFKSLNSKVIEKIKQEIISIPTPSNTQVKILERLKGSLEKTSYLDILVGSGVWVETFRYSNPKWPDPDECDEFSSHGLLKIYWDVLYGKDAFLAFGQPNLVKDPEHFLYNNDFSLRKKTVILEICLTLAKWATPFELNELMDEFIQGNQNNDLVTELCRHRGLFHFRIFGETNSYETYRRALLKCASRYQTLASFLEKTPLLCLEAIKNDEIEFIDMNPTWPPLSSDLIKYLAQYIDNKTMDGLSAVCKDLERTVNTFIEKESTRFNRIFNK